MRAHESNIILSGNVVFSNNTAVSGAAFILVQGSIISLVKNSNVKFMPQILEKCSILVPMIMYILVTHFHIGSVF